MEKIESKAVETYQKNIEYFSTNHPHIANLINVMSISLDNGEYTPKYDLEYMNNYFDVKNISTSNYLYTQNSLEISQELSKRVSYKKDSYLFEGFPLYRVSEGRMGTLDDRSEGFEDILPIMDYYAHNSKTTDTMKQIKKYYVKRFSLCL